MIATAIAVVGVAWVGSHLVRAWPRSVDVAYAFGPDITALDVDYLLDGEAVGSVRFRQTGGDTGSLRDTVSLPPGEYEAHITVYRASGPAVEHRRTLVVPAAGLTRFDLRSDEP
jgi:hypothetical protein